MQIVVLVKQTFDTEAKITLNAEGQIESKGVNLVVDPYSEFAVEEALRIKERLGVGKVIILCVGDESAATAVRHCFSMGADEGYLIADPAISNGDQSITALILSKALDKIPHDLILGGYKTVDNAGAQVCQRVAEQQGIPVVSVITKIDFEEDNKIAVAKREIDDGFEMIEVSLPAIFTAQQGLAEPRYPSMKGIMQAKKKPLQKWTLADLGLTPDQVGSTGSKLKTVGYELPVPRKSGKIIEGELPDAVAEVLKLLRSEAKVI
ncbi:MAG: electron transfer flavoprotein subunit beta/FixA family protein [Desulfitobacteriaceae bacterium]